MSLFRFAKQGQLRDVFPNAAGAQDLIVNQLDATVYLTHPAVGGGGVLDQILSFTINGALGVAQVNGSEIPRGQAFYIPFMVLFHDDAAARRCRIYLRHVVTNRFVNLQDTQVDDTTVSVPGGTGWAIHRPIYVPPGWAIGGEVFALAAGATASLQGGGALLSIADHPPALF